MSVSLLKGMEKLGMTGRCPQHEWEHISYIAFKDSPFADEEYVKRPTQETVRCRNCNLHMRRTIRWIDEEEVR